MASAELVEAIERGDLDELIRLVDRLCSAREWSTLSELRERCHRAHEQSGRQLWPAAAHAEYRLALEAPGEWAGAVLVEGAGRFAPGPLSEVAASTHEWAELAPHVTAGPTAVITAHERVLRGEDLSGLALPGPPVLDLPLRLEPWEPDYCLAEYRAHEADFPAPDLPRPERSDAGPLPPPGDPAADPDAVDALRGVVGAWVDGSAGHADVTAVGGGALEAIAALGIDSARVAPFTGADALASLAWAGAAGGAHGRRRGAAAGRLAAWWAAAAVGGLLDPWPPDPDALGDAIAGLRWFAWDAGTRAGWVLRLAVEDPQSGRAWAIDALDPG